MKFLHSDKHFKPFLFHILKILLALLIIQILRAICMLGLWYALKPGENLALFQALNGISFIIVGVLLLLWFRPSLKELSLDWDDISLRTRIMYILGGLILVTLILLPILLGFELDVIVMGFVFGIIVPAFEELLFRGYIWNKIEGYNNINSDPNSLFVRKSGLITLITVTLLFGIWHLGYVDVFLINPRISHENFSLTTMLTAKVGLGLFLGLILGYVRLKTRKVYASFLLHGFWNTFAP